MMLFLQLQAEGSFKYLQKQQKPGSHSL